MLVLNLQCEAGHGFEGWFGSADDFDDQQSRGLLNCPVCGHAGVQRLPSAPRLNVKAAKAATPQMSVPAPDERLKALQGEVLGALRRLASQTEDVGERFTEEARRIHYGEVAERAIRGRASGEQIVELAEEGIAVLPLPAVEPLQ
ncbi:MAG: DUF1178 family protein [Paucibacter sp.]|nr:DUF1178 family protein [Roseateles sp.]